MATPKRFKAGSNKTVRNKNRKNQKTGKPGRKTLPKTGWNSPLGVIKTEIRNMAGYVAPPQGHFRAKLNQNENPYDIPESIKREILQDMAGLEWTRYPDYNPPSVRRILGERFGIHPDQILVGGGSNQLLYTIGLAVISSGDPVMVAPPTFGLFELVGRFYGGKLISANLNPDFSFDAGLLLRSGKKAKITFISSPNNPTGNTMPLDLLESLLKATPGLVVWDEAYAEFNGVTAIPLLEKYSNLLVLRTFSKAFGLAGLRIGYLMGCADLIAEFSKVNIPYNVNLFSELTAQRMLGDSQWMEERAREIVQNRKKLYVELKTIPGITPFPSEANFILIRFKDSKYAFEKLKEKGVLLRAVNGHPLLKNCLRATVGTPDENRIFIEALKEIIQCGG